MKFLVPALTLILAIGANCAVAADSKPSGTLIDFQAQAQRNAPNDLGNASMYFEADGEKPGELARRVNQIIASALATAKNARRSKGENR